jgi:hypothetical protein
MRTSPKLLIAVLCSIVAVGVTSSVAQEQSATQFYMTYRAAFAKAAKVEDVMPYMSKGTIAQVEKTPAAERPKMFEMIKALGSYTDIKVVKEEKTADGATLSVEGIDSSKEKVTGTVQIVKEGTAWKVGRESWKGSL